MATKYPNHEAVVAWAKRELGTREVPMGSNTGPRVRFYQSHTWLPGTGWPWCAAFVCTAWEEGGKFKLPFPSAGAHDLGNRAKIAGWVVAIDRLIPGDLLDWNIGSGHISIFLSYDRARGVIKSIDGNTMDQVAYRERSAALLRYAIHVPENPIPVKPQEPPKWIVTTSESGTEKVVYVSGPKAVAQKLGYLLKRFGTLKIRKKA